jgi:hypothetical protein
VQERSGMRAHQQGIVEYNISRIPDDFAVRMSSLKGPGFCPWQKAEVDPRRFELRTSRLSVVRSTRLSYGSKMVF